MTIVVVLRRSLIRYERTVSRRETRQRMQWLLLAMAAVAILLAFAGWPMLRVHLQSIAVLDLVGDKPVPSWLRRFVSEPIAVRDLQLPLESGHGASTALHTAATEECAGDCCAARRASSGDRRAEAGELCNRDGGVRRAGADAGAAGHQGLPGRCELDCDDW